MWTIQFYDREDDSEVEDPIILKWLVFALPVFVMLGIAVAFACRYWYVVMGFISRAEYKRLYE